MRALVRLFVAASATFVVASAPHAASADLKVFACVPEWGALAKELGGDKLSIYVATSARLDPHRIEARPSLIARARTADLMVCTGAELEIGWLPALQSHSGNPKIQPGAAGNFEAADYVARLEIPTRLDRADGDVHASGNPHIQLDARNILKIADALASTLILLDPPNAQYYEARHADFAARWRTALVRWEASAKPLRGMALAVQHRNWVYLFDWLGLKEVAALEPKPGVPPSAGHLAGVVETLARTPVAGIVRAPHESAKPSQFISERTGAPAIVLPFTVGGSEAAATLFDLFDDTIARLLALRR